MNYTQPITNRLCACPKPNRGFTGLLGQKLTNLPIKPFCMHLKAFNEGFYVSWLKPKAIS